MRERRELKVSRLLGRGCSGPIAHGLMSSGVRLVPTRPVCNRLIPKLCTEEQLRKDAVLEERGRQLLFDQCDAPGSHPCRVL